MGLCGKLTKYGALLALVAVVVEVASDITWPPASNAQGMYHMFTNFAGLMLPFTGNKARYCERLGGMIFATPEHQRTGVQTLIAKLGGFSGANAAMRQNMDNPEECRKVAQFYCAMANFNREASLIGGQSGAVPLLVEAMRRHPLHAGLQAQASASMGCWCDWTPETEEIVAQNGGPQAILRALKSFPADAHMQFLGWAGLSSVSNRMAGKKLIIEAGAIDFGMSLMRDPVLRKGFRVRQEVIMTLNNIAANCDECAAAIMGTGDIIQQVMEAMDQEVPEAERGTKTDGIQLMMTVTERNATSREAVLKSGFLPYAIDGMQRFPNRHGQSAWPLSEFGLKLFVHMSGHSDEAREEMRRLGCADVVKLVMRAHPEIYERQEAGNRILKNLGVAL